MSMSWTFRTVRHQLARTIGLAVGLLAIGSAPADEDIRNYLLSPTSPNQAGYGYTVECATPGHNCASTTEVPHWRSYSLGTVGTGIEGVAFVKTSSTNWEQYEVTSDVIRLRQEYPNAYFTQDLGWLPRYLNLFQNWTLHHGGVSFCWYPDSCTSCGTSPDNCSNCQAYGDNEAYFSLRLWTPGITPNNIPQYILYRRNTWGGDLSNPTDLEMYYYAPGKGPIGYEHYVRWANGCADTDWYFAADSQHARDNNWCMIAAQYITDLESDSRTKSCN